MKTCLCKDTVGPHTSRQIKTKKQQNTQDHQTTTTRKSPSQTCVSSEKTANQTENQTRHTKGAGARTKHPQDQSEYARRTVGLPSATHVPDIETTLQAVQKILPKLEARMIEFLAEWPVTFLIPATHVLEVRAPYLSFMFLKEYGLENYTSA